MGCRELCLLVAFLTGVIFGLSEEVVKNASEPIVTDKTATVHWENIDGCNELCPEFAALLFQNDNLVSGGVTEDNFFTFEGLEPNQSYVLKVFGFSSSGVNESKHHQIDFTTKSSEAVQASDAGGSSPQQPQYAPSQPPDPMRDLTVYKTTHNSISVKWLKPVEVRGSLIRFQLFWSSKSGVAYTDKTAFICGDLPNPNKDIYCHTFNRLRPGTEYTLRITGRNNWSKTYSNPVSVRGRTKDEPGPDTPTNLQISNLASTSFELTWIYPASPKITPRTFLVKVTETERYDKERCCDTFPQLEIPFTSGQTSYKTEVTDLNPASTYTVNVIGKSKSLGEPASQVVYTRPPRLGLEGESISVKLPVRNIRFIRQQPPSDESMLQLYRPLISGRMIVALTTDLVPAESSGVRDEQLNALIRSTFNCSFFVIMDYDKDVKGILSLEETEGAYKGKWGENKWKYNNDTGCYRLVGVQVTKYMKSYGISYSSDGEPFQPRVFISPFTYKLHGECYTKLCELS